MVHDGSGESCNINYDDTRTHSLRGLSVLQEGKPLTGLFSLMEHRSGIYWLDISDTIMRNDHTKELLKKYQVDISRKNKER